MLLHYFDDPLTWKESKMATKHNYLKSLKLQSQCMQVNFIFTVCRNIMWPSLLPRILWLLCFSFIQIIVLFTFYACKKDTNNISNRHKTKTNIAIYKLLGKSKDQYIHKLHANFQDFTQSGALGFYNWEKGVKVRMRENVQ